MKYRRIFSLFLTVVGGIQACHLFSENNLGSNAKNKLLVSGSSTVAPLAEKIADRYQVKHPRIQIQIQTGGSSKGIENVRQGISDIGMVSRDLTEDEADLLAFPIARDGISILVHQGLRSLWL